MSPDELATACAATMWADDSANHWLGTEIVSVGAGRAIMSLQVTDRHLNSHRICHGGYIFALADTAFAYASNSHNQWAVAQHNQITYLSPAQPGETLTASAVEVSRKGRSGIYDVTVTADDGRMVALLRAHSRTISGQHVPDPDAPDAAM
jgi:acyl-CoA thioesterase